MFFSNLINKMNLLGYVKKLTNQSKLNFVKALLLKEVLRYQVLPSNCVAECNKLVE